jgi:hypothetical protein
MNSFISSFHFVHEEREEKREREMDRNKEKEEERFVIYYSGCS